MSWPAALNGDYDQDGLVSINDLTPLGMLFGLSRGTEDSVWLADAYQRVDGNGDGEINISDLTLIGANFGNANPAFRVERSAGDADGPGAPWEDAGEAAHSNLTRSGEPAGGTAQAAYQRFRDAVRPGWTYYRVVALSDGAAETSPTPACSRQMVRRQPGQAERS